MRTEIEDTKYSYVLLFSLRCHDLISGSCSLCTPFRENMYAISNVLKGLYMATEINLPDDYVYR